MNHFLTKIFEIYNQSKSKIEFPWNWEEIENTYEQEPELFENIFKRSSLSRYDFQEELLANSLWIALNVTDSYLKRPQCYYCGSIFKLTDYFSGAVHIDHFNPITQNYTTGCPKFCFKTEIGFKINGTLFCRDE
ncbi:HNH endonuclease domain protein [Leptospira santarosai]|nr:HNH endonuclease domain protein [Leptospira santarosai]